MESPQWDGKNAARFANAASALQMGIRGNAELQQQDRVATIPTTGSAMDLVLNRRQEEQQKPIMSALLKPQKPRS